MTPTSAPSVAPQITAADKMFDAVFERALDFRITMDYDAARRFIERIDQYNDFDHHEVLQALDEIDRLIPRQFYGEGNPNNGRRKYEITVGREGSPVVYLDWHEFSGPRIADETLKAICDEMTVIGHADEADFDVEDTILGGRKITFRFWWD
jgi:hypothetical protein